MESPRSMVWVTDFWEDSQQLVLPWLGRVRLRGRLVSSRGPGGDTSGLADVQYRRLSTRMDAMYESQSRFAQELTKALGTAFRGLGADIQWPIYGEGSVYPPPDTPAPEGDDDDSE